MPNTGRPSRDCHHCRQRRVRCDLVRPGCGQCQRKGQPCPGYRDELDQRFRSQNVDSFSARRSGSRRKAKDEALSRRSGKMVETIPVTKATLPPRSMLSESWNEHLMPLVIHKLSSDAVDGSVCHTIFTAVLHVVSSAKPGSAIFRVCDAIGRVYIANLTNSPLAKVQQARAYGGAIATIKNSLQNPQQSASRETIVSVLLLCIYELLSAPDTHSILASPSWSIHTRGMIALLEYQQGTGSCKPEDRSLFLAIFSTVQRQTLIMSQDYSWEFLSWIRAFYRLCVAADLWIARTVIFAYHCSRLCVAIQELIDIGNPDALLAIYPSIMHHVDNVDNETAHLSHYRPLGDSVIDTPTTGVPLSSAVPDRGLLIYQKTFRLQLSMQAHKLLSIASEEANCTPEQRVHIGEARTRCTKEYQSIADQVLARLAVATGHDVAEGSGTSVKPLGLLYIFHIVWPLQLIASSPMSSEKETRQARALLEGIHKQSRRL